MLKKIALIALLISVTACSQTRHYVNGHSVEGAREVKDDTDYFISGLAQKKKIDAQQICGGPDKVIATETFRSPVNIVLSLLTFGIYTPQEQTVYCKR